MPGSDRYFTAGGARLRYRDEGAGLPVALIHGWTLDLECFEPQVPGLARAARVIRHDRRGFGLSEGEPALAQDVDDLAALLDALDVRSAVLVGASQGARVALAFALLHPDLVAGLVLDGPPDETGREAAAGDADFSIDAFRELARREGVDAFRRAWRDHPFMKLHTPDVRMRALLDAMLARYPGRDLLATAQVRPPAGTEALARCRAPALVVSGEHDTAARLRAGERLAAVLPAAERAVVPGAGHLPNLDNPAAYERLVLEFLQRRARAAA
jgi:3-oxoadipate enol-lactonase